MSLSLLFKDELKGFYKSKVMIFLWLGLPLVSVLFHLVSPDTGDEIPFSAISAILVASIGGTLSAAMLTVSIINEKNNRVYDLFLIRPIRRRNLLLSKFLAVYLCVAMAGFLALVCGILIDHFNGNLPPDPLMEETLNMFIIGMSMIAIAASAGILIGVASPSVLVGVILVIYGGNQLSALPLIPTALDISNKVLFTVILGVVITVLLLTISILHFDRKQF
jgi:ABC-2 type transport system permease protein